MSDIKNTLENLIESTYKVEQEYRVLSASYENMRKFLRQIVESLGAALWVVDASGKVVLENSLASSLSDVFASIKALGKSGEIELTPATSELAGLMSAADKSPKAASTA